MRSSLNEEHLSGAERIVNGNVGQVIPELINQAVSSCKMPDRIVLSLDAIDPSSVIYTAHLNIRTIDSLSPEDAEKAAADILKCNGVSPVAIESAFRLCVPVRHRGVKSCGGLLSWIQLQGSGWNLIHQGVSGSHVLTTPVMQGIRL